MRKLIPNVLYLGDGIRDQVTPPKSKDYRSDIAALKRRYYEEWYEEWKREDTMKNGKGN